MINFVLSVMFSSPAFPGQRRISMADIMSILQSSYSAASSQSLIPAGAKFAAVDPTKYQGTWTGKDSTGKAFSLVISKVSGYRANVTYQSAAGGQQYQRVFISTKGSFRIGDSSFTLTGKGTALVDTILTDPTTGIQSAEKAPATRTTT
jgi:hypothetical protein